MTQLDGTMTGAQAVIRSLELLGVTDVFGLPGGAILEVYDPLFDSQQLRHILVRHEQGAGHAAQGYAVASGKLGVCMATSGPGATNLVTAIGDAYMDSVPILAITGQVYSHLLGSDAFQEADIIGITMPITKHSFSVRRAEDVPGALAAAAEIAMSGRPGPVLVDITKDAQQRTLEFSWPPYYDLSGYKAPAKRMPRLDDFFALLAASRRPVIYAGGGVIRAGAGPALREFAEHTGIPVVTTLTARGAFPDSHRQNLGMPGMHGTVPAVMALQKSDLLITLGARFDDRVTGKLDSFAPDAKVIHIDIDPAEIGKNREADLPIVSDLKYALETINAQINIQKEQNQPHHLTQDLTAWWKSLDRMRESYPLIFEPYSEDGQLSPGYVIKLIGELSGPEAVYTTGVGQHQMWAAQAISYERPNSFLTSGGAGTMGYAVPAAMGAKVAQPNRTVWAIDGDGCFQMTNQELVTCAINNIPIKVAIINNSSLGMVRQWQRLFYNERYSHTSLHTGAGTVALPDFVKLAEACGCLGIRATTLEEAQAAVELALATNDRPVVIDFVVSEDSMVWPMVPQGVGNSELQYVRDQSPVWEEDE